MGRCGLGVASVAYFTRRKGGVIMQNSGLGNVIHPLNSFSLMDAVPVLLLGWWPLIPVGKGVPLSLTVFCIMDQIN